MIQSIDKDGKLSDWYTVDGRIVQELVVREIDLTTQVQAIAGQIAFWARMVAQTKRVWEIRERELRKWKAAKYFEVVKAAEKKPTEAKIAAEIRLMDGYEEKYTLVEAAEEAHNAAAGILDGFKAKRDQLRAHAYRPRDDGSKLTI